MKNHEKIQPIKLTKEEKKRRAATFLKEFRRARKKCFTKLKKRGISYTDTEEEIFKMIS